MSLGELFRHNTVFTRNVIDAFQPALHLGELFRIHFHRVQVPLNLRTGLADLDRRGIQHFPRVCGFV